MTEARASMTLLPLNSLESRKHSVTRTLSPGMDICPDIWRYSDRNAAQCKFNDVVSDLQARGFKIEQTTIV